jgi:hypothetical protein
MDVIVLALTIFFALFTLFGFLRGVRRGMYRQALRFGSTLLSILLAFLLTRALSDFVLDMFGTESIGNILVLLRDQGYISADVIDITKFANYLSAVKWLVALPVTTLILPFVFTILFILLNLFIKIVYLIVSRFVSKTEDDVDKMFVGAVIGAIEGLIVAVVIVLPAINILSLCDAPVDNIRANNDNGRYTAVLEEYDEVLGPLMDAPVVKMAAFIGSPVTRGLSKVDMGGEKVILRDELVTMVTMQLEFLYLTNDPTFTEAETNEEKFAVIRSWANRVTSSVYLAEIISDVLRDSSSLIENEVIAMDEEADPSSFFTYGLTQTFIRADRHNLKIIFNTLLDATFYMVDQGMFEGYSNNGSIGDEIPLYDKDGNNKITHVIGILNACEYTRPLVNTLSKLAVASVFDGYTEEIGGISITYDDVQDSFNQVVAVQRKDYATEDEYKVARQAALNQVFLDHGVDNADPAVLEDICEYLDKEYPDIESMDDEKFNDIIFSGISYYVENQKIDNPDEIPEIPEVPENGETPESSEE